jgi:hypothetical protein
MDPMRSVSAAATFLGGVHGAAMRSYKKLSTYLTIFTQFVNGSMHGRYIS